MLKKSSIIKIDLVKMIINVLYANMNLKMERKLQNFPADIFSTQTVLILGFLKIKFALCVIKK